MNSVVNNLEKHFNQFNHTFNEIESLKTHLERVEKRMEASSLRQNQATECEKKNFNEIHQFDEVVISNDLFNYISNNL